MPWLPVTKGRQRYFQLVSSDALEEMICPYWKPPCGSLAAPQRHTAAPLLPASPPQELINHHLAKEGTPRTAHVGARAGSPPQRRGSRASHQGCSSITAGGSGMRERQSCCGSARCVPWSSPQPCFCPRGLAGGRDIPRCEGCSLPAAAAQLRLVPRASVVFPSLQAALAQPQRDQLPDDSQRWPG